MSSVSMNGLFSVTPVRDTITQEEIPKIAMRIATIITSSVELYEALLVKDVHKCAEACVKIYDDLTAIKKMIES